jgi:hypothetical protein
MDDHYQREHTMAIERRQIPRARQGLGCFAKAIVMTRSRDADRQDQSHFCTDLLLEQTLNSEKSIMDEH